MARQVVLAARPEGKPKLTDFRLEETAIPTPAARQLLLGVQYLSLDPYMRGRMDDRKSYAKPLQIGDVMTGESPRFSRRFAKCVANCEKLDTPITLTLV
jgi:NADPH-dependent curcumin reductase